jgi:hypothetical protein
MSWTGEILTIFAALRGCRCASAALAKGRDANARPELPECVRPGSDAIEHATQRAVSHDLVAHQEQKQRLPHRIARGPQRARIGERDGGVVVARDDEIIDRLDLDLASFGQITPAWVIANCRLVGRSRQQNKPSRQGLRQRRDVARGEQRR